MNKKIILATLTILSTLFLNLSTADAQLSWLKNTLRNLKSDDIENIKNLSLSQTRIGEGLKEALKVGITNTVSKVGQTDGYFTNDQIKLMLPDKLQRLDQAMRMIGFDDQLDSFILSMNRAAETAAPHARDIFLDALFEMSFDDAAKIYQGGDTAATDFFRRTAYDKLYQAFKPRVEESLNNYNVTSSYKNLVGKYRAIPFSKKLPVPSIDDYVVRESLEGLFHVLGQEEAKIRTNPSARVTDLLREVFK